MASTEELIEKLRGVFADESVAPRQKAEAAARVLVGAIGGDSGAAAEQTPINDPIDLLLSTIIGKYEPLLKDAPARPTFDLKLAPLPRRK